ncbi:hypothetical protein N7490_009497 [Penicillium lividum]|nr:hypothetical protein N7490_009497 [Penicillium lividum]
MDSLERYPPSYILREIANCLDRSHHLVHLSSNEVTYEEALQATLNCIRETPGQISLPTTKPIPTRRQRLREIAEDVRSKVPSFEPPTLPFRTPVKLAPEGFPQPDPDLVRRQRLRERALEDLRSGATPLPIRPPAPARNQLHKMPSTVRKDSLDKEPRLPSLPGAWR